MFEELLKKYGDRIGTIPQSEQAAFLLAEEQLAAKRKVQADLKGGFESQRGKDELKGWSLAKWNDRLRLIKEQLDFTLEAEELNLLVKELEDLQQRAGRLEGDNRALLEELDSHQREVAQRRRVLDAARVKAARGKAAAAAANMPAPVVGPLTDPDSQTTPVLVKQQLLLLQMESDEIAVMAALTPSGSGPLALDAGGLETLAKQQQACAEALADARRLADAHVDALPALADLRAQCEGLGTRSSALQVGIEQALRAETEQAAADCLTEHLRSDLEQLPRAVAATARAIRTAIERQASEHQREHELRQNEAVANASVLAWLGGGIDATTPAFVVGELKKPAGLELVELFGQAGGLDELQLRIAALFEAAGQIGDEQARKDKLAAAQALSDMLNALHGVRMNELVQDYYHLTRKSGASGPQDSLTVPEKVKENKRKRTPADDSDFLNATNSAQGDFNSPSNLGKYSYHLTALGNILRAVGEGISVTGLAPGKGGLAGGSCELSEASEPFFGSNIKDASIVNSQNKVASATARQESMRTYIQQREKQVDDLMHADREADAAKATSVMLRFPLRAEYLGKFDKDPIHLTDNLALLDGTPIPPADIEALLHHLWVPITADQFQDAYREMFELPPRTV